MKLESVNVNANFATVPGFGDNRENDQRNYTNAFLIT